MINPTLKNVLHYNVSLRMFTRSVVIQRRVEDLQLGVESYQKKLNLTKPDTDGTLYADSGLLMNITSRESEWEYLPQTSWSHRDKDKMKSYDSGKIDKRLKTMRSISASLRRDLLGEDNTGELTTDCFKGPYDLSYVVLYLIRAILVDPYGFEGYLKMVVEVPDSS
ncbi:hypothetical protein Tco_0233231 [Tanacetum coccineum]